jgi:hypothetical protein
MARCFIDFQRGKTKMARPEMACTVYFYLLSVSLLLHPAVTSIEVFVELAHGFTTFVIF